MGFFRNLFGGRRDNSAELAKQRLLTVLVDDRYKLTPDTMAQLKAELAEVLARYLPVEATDIDVSIMRGEANDHLKADIPLRRSNSSEEHG
ncbi:MAG: cell division topological specificity factor MinE [Chloroflexaceae bacterium]|nr:cell division topological specificity factor MinE [Chloroflexaceae bacterium]